MPQREGWPRRAAPCGDGNRRLFIYFEHLNQCIKLQISGFPLRRQKQKNWTVMVVGDVIYINYSFNPSIVFRVDNGKTGFCSLAPEHLAFTPFPRAGVGRAR